MKRRGDGSKVAVAGYGIAGIVSTETITVLVPEPTRLSRAARNAREALHLPSLVY
jgi:hypothetical protein